LLVAVFVMVVGMAGVFTPDSLIAIGRSVAADRRPA